MYIEKIHASCDLIMEILSKKGYQIKEVIYPAERGTRESWNTMCISFTEKRFAPASAPSDFLIADLREDKEVSFVAFYPTEHYEFRIEYYIHYLELWALDLPECSVENLGMFCS